MNLLVRFCKTYQIQDSRGPSVIHITSWGVNICTLKAPLGVNMDKILNNKLIRNTGMTEPGGAPLVWTCISSWEFDGLWGRASMGYLSSTSQPQAIKVEPSSKNDLSSERWCLRLHGAERSIALPVSHCELWSWLTECDKMVPQFEFSCISWPLISTWDIKQPVWLACVLIFVSVCICPYNHDPVWTFTSLYIFVFASAKQTWWPHGLFFQSTTWDLTHPAAGKRHGNRTPDLPLFIFFCYGWKQELQEIIFAMTRNGAQLVWQRLFLSCRVLMFEVFRWRSPWCWNTTCLSSCPHRSATCDSDHLIVKYLELEQVRFPMLCCFGTYFNDGQLCIDTCDELLCFNVFMKTNNVWYVCKCESIRPIKLKSQK